MWKTLAISMLAAALGACGDGPPAADASPCDPVTTSVAHAQGVHIPFTETPTYATNPPASGPHYQIWARWARSYGQPIPRGYYVHNQEHGGVTISYNCPAGCPEIVAQLQAVASGFPHDPICPPAIAGRWIITPDPLLPPGVAVAASAWAQIYTASCVDVPTLTRFYLDNEGQGPEMWCTEGGYPPPGVDAGPADGGPDAGPPDAAP